MTDFGVDDCRPAVIAIDCHHGHLAPDVATMPAPADVAARLVENNRVFFEKCRAAGIPVIHIVTTYRDVPEIVSNPFWRTIAGAPGNTRGNLERHNLEGSIGCAIMPGLHDEAKDLVVRTKKRYDCFQGTDLEATLRSHGINTLLITGINTNSCVLATAISASVKDYAAIVIEDCVDTMDGPDFHSAALKCIETAFGWVMSSDEALEAVG
ncbi:MAG: cysteine hydrolase [Rhodospirillales bacterium]